MVLNLDNRSCVEEAHKFSPLLNSGKVLFANLYACLLLGSLAPSIRLCVCVYSCTGHGVHDDALYALATLPAAATYNV